MREPTKEKIETYALAGIGLTKGVFNLVLETAADHRPNRSNSANYGWAAIGTGVLAWDVLAPETLSEGVDRALEKRRFLTSAAIGITAAHLLNLLPESIDPIHQLAKRTRSHFHPS